MNPILLTVNRRLARTFKTTFQGRVLSWDDFLLELFEQNRASCASSLWRLSAMQEQTLWARAMADFPTFGFAREQMIDCARDAYALVKAYQLDPDSMQGYKEDSDLFVTALKRFEEECAVLNAFSFTALIEQLLLNACDQFPTDHLYCYGFDEWTPAQQVLVNHWESAGIRVEHMPQLSRNSNIKKIIANDARDEFQRAARYAKSAFERNETVAIVVPQLQAKWAEVEHQLAEIFYPTFCFPGVSAQTPPYNISSGASLDKEPIIYCLLETLKLLDKDIRTQTWSNVLHSPFVRGGCSEAASRAAFDMRMRENQTLTLPLKTLQSSSLIPMYLKNQLDHVAQMREALTKRSMREWISWLIDWINMWGWAQERTLSSPEYQAVDTMHDVLPQLYSLDILAPTYSFHEFNEALYRLLKNTLFQTETQDKPIQVLGLLEAAGLSFDHVWVIGLTADNNPAKSMPHPFIPTQIQINHDMPHSSPERELRVAQRLLDRLILGADNLIVSYAAHDEKGEPQLESPLIAAYAIDTISQQPMERMSVAIAQTRKLEPYQDWVGAPLTEKHLKGGSSVLRDQAACPHRAYLKHRLNARSPKSPVLGLSPSDQGTLIHRVLEKIWDVLKTRSALIRLDNEALSHEIYNHIESVLNAWRPALSDSNKTIESQRAYDIISAWLTYEKSRGDFSVVSLEKNVEIVLNDLTLTLKMDRIDCVGEQQYLLMDYKTGEVHKSAWGTPRMDEPQLPLYAAFMSPTPVGMAFACLKKSNIGFEGLIDDQQWEVLLDQFRDDLLMLAEEVQAGYAETKPKYAKTTCAKCDLEAGCRFHTGGVYER